MIRQFPFLVVSFSTFLIIDVILFAHAQEVRRSFPTSPDDISRSEITGTHSPDFIQLGAHAAIGKWSANNGCAVAGGASRVIVERMISEHEVLVEKAASLEPYQKPRLTEAATRVYMDEIAAVAGIDGGQGCLITESMVEVSDLPKGWFDPVTGFLHIDGSDDGAQILIDGEPRGQIDQKFILTVGTHEWETMGCRQSIDIEENLTKEVYCDEQ